MTNLKRLIITAMCIALCVVLPIAFHSIPNGGSIFCPMHIPVLLCGLICGGLMGMLCGIAGPILSSIITQMPPMGYLAPMVVELFVYGLAAGLLMRLFGKQKYIFGVYFSLVSAMLLGRAVAGVAKALVFMPGEFGIKMFVVGYFGTSWPGIVIQLLLIPAVMAALRKAKLI